MLAHQAAGAWRIWFGDAPPVALFLEAARA
jgi:shikimate 5-dehydrogenase